MNPPPPLIWKELSGVPKLHHLTTLQRALDDTARRMGVHTPIVATPVLIKLTLSLYFLLDHQDNLLTGLHQFGMGQNTYDSRKVMKARIDQHHVIAGGVGAPYLADAVTLTVPDGYTCRKPWPWNRAPTRGWSWS